MRKLFWILNISLLLSCSSEEGGSTVQETNPAPNETNETQNPVRPNPDNNGLPVTNFTLIEPENLSLCTPENLLFVWSLAQRERFNTYRVQIATDPNFNSIYESVLVNGDNRNFSFDRGQAYYWRVRVEDENVTGAYSETFGFYTEGEVTANYIPFLSELSPTNNQQFDTDTRELVLSWNGNDINGDISKLKYTVRFEEGENVNTPDVLVENYSNTTIAVDVRSGEIYKWSVDVEDEEGSINRGLVRTFRVRE